MGLSFIFFTWGFVFFFEFFNADCFRFQKYFSHWFVLLDDKCFFFARAFVFLRGLFLSLQVLFFQGDFFRRN